MIEVGEPFAFCGRIVEAYYTNPELDTVAIMWSDGEKNREYYVVVDEEDDQFQALLKEWSYESLDECTINRNEAGRQEFKDAFHRYVEQQKLYSEDSEEKQASLNILFDFDSKNDEHKEELFKLKLKIFEQEVVQKSKAREKKTSIRKAKTPLEAIILYNSFLK